VHLFTNVSENIFYKLVYKNKICTSTIPHKAWLHICESMRKKYKTLTIVMKGK
jgi:hypothetical protein